MRWATLILEWSFLLVLLCHFAWHWHGNGTDTDRQLFGGNRFSMKNITARHKCSDS